MSRNRITISRDLEPYLDDLMDGVDAEIRNQRDDNIREISRLDLNKESLYSCAAEVADYLYEEKRFSVTKAIDDAAAATVNASIYANLRKNRALDALSRELEEDLEEDYNLVNDASGDDRGRDRGRGRDRDRNDRPRSARDSRAVAAQGSREPERDRNRGGRDRVDREEEQRRADERAKLRDGTVEAAKENIEKNKIYQVNEKSISEHPELFCSPDKSLALAPVYWLGAHAPVIIDNQIQFEKTGENVEWERHRTDLYLQVRASIKPSVSERDNALQAAVNARDMYIKQVITRLENEQNVVEEKIATNYTQVRSEENYIGKFYGVGSPIEKIQACLSDLKLNALPRHPLTVRVENYPMWVMNKELTAAVEDLVASTNLKALIPALIRVMNVATPEQWAYFHDRTTDMINKALKVELEVRPYLNSIISEWPSFAGWLERHKNGELVSWFGNNLTALIRRTFHVYKHGSQMAHTFVDGSDEKFASVSAIERIIYLPINSENFGAASATKLGRVLESGTPKLFKLLANNIDAESRTTYLATSSDESVEVHKRLTSLTTDIVFMGQVNW